jgi:hypothetical protein
LLICTAQGGSRDSSSGSGSTWDVFPIVFILIKNYFKIIIIYLRVILSNSSKGNRHMGATAGHFKFLFFKKIFEHSWRFWWWYWWLELDIQILVLPIGQKLLKCISNYWLVILKPLDMEFTIRCRCIPESLK